MAGGTRKYGRNKKRPAQQRYVGEQRHDKNKRLNAQRHEKRMAKKAAKLIRRSNRPRLQFSA